MRMSRTKSSIRLPKQDRSRSTVDSVIEATAQILSREGRERLTTNRVAEVAGVSIGTVYQYFGDKEALLAELGRRYEERFLERLVESLGRLGALPLREAVPAFVRFIAEMHAENPRLHNEIAPSVPSEQRRTLSSFTRAYFEAHREELRPEDLDLAAYLAVETGEALVHGTALREPERLRDERFLEEVSELLLRYLAR